MSLWTRSKAGSPAHRCPSELFQNCDAARLLDEAESAPPEMRPVRTVTVVKRDTGETVAFTGRIEAENETRLAFRSA